MQLNRSHNIEIKARGYFTEKKNIKGEELDTVNIVATFQ